MLIVFGESKNWKGMIYLSDEAVAREKGSKFLIKDC